MNKRRKVKVEQQSEMLTVRDFGKSLGMSHEWVRKQISNAEWRSCALAGRSASLGLK